MIKIYLVIRSYFQFFNFNNNDGFEYGDVTKTQQFFDPYSYKQSLKYKISENSKDQHFKII